MFLSYFLVIWSYIYVDLGIFTEKENDKGHTGKQRKGESTNIKVFSEKTLRFKKNRN